MKNVDSNILDTVTRILQALCELGEWYMIEESAVVILNFIQSEQNRIRHGIFVTEFLLKN